ncbi:MAG: hypothetical protein H7Z40_04715 [Phycisphaerae bacterium]|nr:hypothetical protein [Gemmatimonadaceae bacterium]
MYELLRFSGSSATDASIEPWFDTQHAALGSIARSWFAQRRECGADVRELLHDGCPMVCVHDVPFA